MTGSPRLSEPPPVDLAVATDPVAAFLAAHRSRRRVAVPTSGTSGTPRRVVRSTSSWVASFDAVAELCGLGRSSVVWVPGPLSASMNLFAAVHAVCAGASWTDRPEAATHAQLTPAGLSRALEDRVDLRGVDVVVAGDRLPPVLGARAVEAGARVHHYYGAAELSFVAWGSHGDDLGAFPGVEVTVRDGVVWVRSPYVAEGYVGPPGPLRCDPDGFASVGDRGCLDDGVLSVQGRADAVTVGGRTVEPAVAESVLREAAEGEVVVVGLPHGTWGSVLAGVLSLTSDLDAVRAVARAELDGAARPRLWFHLDPLPVTAAGKVDRAAVVSRVSGDAGRATRLV